LFCDEQIINSLDTLQQSEKKIIKSKRLINYLLACVCVRACRMMATDAQLTAMAKGAPLAATYVFVL
jgi:hypothetical protein